MKLKKMMTSILAAAMVLSTMSFTVFADAQVYEVKDDTELASAISSASDGDTIKLAEGTYTGGLSVGKNVILEGSVDNEGTPTTIFSGDNGGSYYAYSIYMNKGTIKNIKIVDAWKGIMTEGKGSLTIDNVTIVEAGYGIHIAESKNAEDTVLVQKSNIDVTWANSFAGGAYTLILKNNILTSNNPYYTDGSGSPVVNTFVPSTTVEENIFGEDAKICIRDAAKDTAVIGTNFYADGYENAIYEDGADVAISTYYATKEKTEVLVVPTGTITTAYVSVSDIWGELRANASKSIEIEIYSNDEKIAKTTLNNIGGIIDGDVYVTWHNNIIGNFDEYWTTEWYNGNPVISKVPTKVVLICDGKAVAENEVQMNGPDNLNPVKWEEVNGVGCEWLTDTDAGYYVQNETKYGILRFLFDADYDGEVTGFGIKYSKASDITEEVTTDNKTVGETGNQKTFYGDLIGITENSTDKYYAIAYIKLGDKYYWSDVVEGLTNWTNDYTDYMGGVQ